MPSHALFIDDFEDLAPGAALGMTPTRMLGGVTVTYDPGFATTLNAASYTQVGPGDIIAFASGAGGVANAPDDPSLVSGDIFLTTSAVGVSQGFPGLEIFFDNAVQAAGFTTINLAERNRTVTLTAYDANDDVVDTQTVIGNAPGTQPAPNMAGRVVSWDVSSASADIVRLELVSSNFDGWGIDDFSLVVPTPATAGMLCLAGFAGTRRRSRDA